MKKNRITILIIVLLLLAIVVWLLIPKRSSLSRHSPTVAIAKQGTTNLPRESPSKSTLAKYPSYVSNGNTYVVLPSNIVEAVRRRDAERAKEDPNRWWKTPVSFYGRVVDENGQPIPQANVKFGLNDTSIRGTSEYYTQSDASGLFSLTGVKGKFLGVHITKEEYYQSRLENNTFDYAGGNNIFNPDRNNPVVFRLHKGGEKVALIKKEFEVHIKVGEAVTIDLLTGKTNSPNSQLQVELLENEPFRRKIKGTWSMRVSAIDGGIQFQTEEFPFLAPESGYRPSIDLGPDSEKPPTWKGSGYYGGAFYLQTHNGYANVKIQAIPGNSYFRLSYYLNPSGSRNLEPDPNLLFRDLDSYNRYIAKQKQATK